MTSNWKKWTLKQIIFKWQTVFMKKIEVSKLKYLTRLFLKTPWNRMKCLFTCFCSKAQKLLTKFLQLFLLPKTKIHENDKIVKLKNSKRLKSIYFFDSEWCGKSLNFLILVIFRENNLTIVFLVATFAETNNVFDKNSVKSNIELTQCGKVVKKNDHFFFRKINTFSVKSSY